MLRPKALLLFFVLVLSFAWLSSSGLWKRTTAGWTGNPPEEHEPSDHTMKKLRLKTKDAAAFIKQNNYNNNICFLVDMNLPSGQNRFFVYDLNRDTLQNAGLVTHGRCNENWLEGRKYGNTVGCGCTSLGKYKIGYSYNGKFGLAFKLHGLEKTNDKAFARFVVLHAHDCVPGTEIDSDICQSDGCPTVAPGFLQQLKPIINESKKPVLLWIYQ
ncbi:MAG TPA: murein L,D-transpeptidase catalytic domain family protein [Chitinophagaceae bacterium]